MHQALDRFGRIDTLVNNAGVFVAKPFTDYTDEVVDAAIYLEQAGFVTGEILHVDGGQSVGH